MSYDQYWDGDVSAHKAYRAAEKLRLSEKNQMAWIQGMYIYEAIASLSPALKAFAKGRARPYRSEPYDIFEDERKRREEREERERYEKMKEKVAAFAEAFNKNRKESEVTDNAGCIN